MRPLRLELQGVTCYRDQQPPLDFGGMSLFAIAGPTGAGKSTVLDAILYALYGTVPRLVGRDAKLGDFISQGSNVLSVCLDFCLRGETFRLVRKAKVNSKGQLNTSATLAQLVNGIERSLASGVTDVDAEVEQRLGVDFNAFTQTVILPQNQFATFLRAKPKEQRTILQHLLGHAIYPRMRELVQAKCGSLASRLRSVEDQLVHLAGATPEALEQIDTQLVDARITHETALRLYSEASIEYQELRKRRDLTLELEKWTAAATRLGEQAPSIEAFADELGRARKAALVTPLIDAVADACRRAAKARDDLSGAADAERKAKKTFDEAQTSLGDATAGAAPLEEWQAQLRRFDQITSDLDRLPWLIKALADAQKAVGPAERRVKDAESAYKGQHDAAKDAAAGLAAAIAARDAVKHDPDLQTQLEAHLTDVATVRATAQRVREVEAALDAVRLQTNQAEESLAAARAAHTSAAEAYENAKAARERAEREYEAGVQQDMAAALRHTLNPGQPCPVCDQIVATMPTAMLSPKLTVLSEARTGAVVDEQSAKTMLDAAAGQLMKAESTTVQVRSRAQELEHEITAKKGAQSDTTARIGAVVGVPVSVSLDSLLDAFDAALRSVRAAALERQRRDQEVTKARTAQGEAALAAAKREAEWHTEEERLRRAHEDFERCTTAVADVRARIAAVTSAEDPARERAEVARRIADAEQALKAATATAQIARQRWTEAQARVDSLAPLASDAAGDLTQAESRMVAAFTEQVFDSVEAVKQASRTLEQIAALDQKVSIFRSEHEAAATRVVELTTEIGNRAVSSDELAAAEETLVRTRKSADDAVAATSRLEEQRRHLAEDVRRAANLIAERNRVQAEHSIAAEMESDLRSDGFQDFLLTEAFRSLVAGASTRLRQMSRRYTMEWRDGDFFVLDHDNAGERRRAETLSGGETFMASLCLALQLSDEILHASGAVRMDSLFIDEGFGSLDPVSLGEVADALDNLRADGDRLVGIISHIPELTDRLPGCIRIEKGVGESRWVVERVG